MHYEEKLNNLILCYLQSGEISVGQTTNKHQLHSFWSVESREKDFQVTKCTDNQYSQCSQVALCAKASQKNHIVSFLLSSHHNPDERREELIHQSESPSIYCALKAISLTSRNNCVTARALWTFFVLISVFLFFRCDYTGGGVALGTLAMATPLCNRFENLFNQLSNDNWKHALFYSDEDTGTYTWRLQINQCAPCLFFSFLICLYQTEKHLIQLHTAGRCTEPCYN